MSSPTIRVLSLGAGVQSTVLALMACDGTLPDLDAAIFADTGWEPPAVYEQVDRLAAEFGRAGIDLYRVSTGNLRADYLDPAHRFVSVPYFTRTDGRDGMARRQCTSEYKLKPIKKHEDGLITVCASCAADWPCPTSRLVYRSDELGEES